MNNSFLKSYWKMEVGLYYNIITGIIETVIVTLGCEVVIFYGKDWTEEYVVGEVETLPLSDKVNEQVVNALIRMALSQFNQCKKQ